MLQIGFDFKRLSRILLTIFLLLVSPASDPGEAEPDPDPLVPGSTQAGDPGEAEPDPDPLAGPWREAP